MSHTNHGGPKLPSTLRDKIEPSVPRHGSSSYDHRRAQIGGRKEQRKALRQQKKQLQSRQHRALPNRASKFEDHTSSDQDESGDGPLSVRRQHKNTSRSGSTRFSAGNPQASPLPTASSPLSRAMKAKLEEDDAEIAMLERKLGLKGKKKLSYMAGEDELEGLLDGLDGHTDGNPAKRKHFAYEDFLSSKRKHPKTAEEFPIEDDSYESNTPGSVGRDDAEYNDPGTLSATGTDDQSANNEDEFGGFDDTIQKEYESDYSTIGDKHDIDKTSETESRQRQTKQRENPYVAPVSHSTAASKYIPPSMRRTVDSDVENLTRLRRQLRGSLNRLSVGNLISILRDVENTYASSPRQHVTTTLVDLLMELLCDRTMLMDTFIILHAGFASAVYKVVGAHFGAQLLERIVCDFDSLYDARQATAVSSKETTNLIVLLAELYTFQLVGSNVIFDYIRLFLADLSELNTELLLKIIKSCGPQLRHDDPSSLKDITFLIQKSVADIGAANLPVRTRFMIEAINDLKNNRQKINSSASSVAAEHTTRMKKTLAALNTRSNVNEPLGVGLADIKISSKEGKWWLVGASWRNEAQKPKATNQTSDRHPDDSHRGGNEVVDDSTELLLLAKEQGMNTDVRRTIFTTIMSASDYKDAHMRLIKLTLKKAQELETPRVLIHCAGASVGYNPYYTLIAKQLCVEHRYRWAMQYGLWELFSRMGEKSNSEHELYSEEHDDDENLDLRRVVNLGQMYGHLIADDTLSLVSLKVLNFAYLQAKTRIFLEVLFTTAFKQHAKCKTTTKFKSLITTMVLRAKSTPQVITGIQFFLSTQLREGASDDKTSEILKRASTIIAQIVI